MLPRLHRLTLTFPLELVVWLGGLTYLALLDPLASQDPITLCVSRLAGLGPCPGCGLGESVSLLLHGDLAGSLRVHILGPFALAVISFRIVTLIRTLFDQERKEHSYGQTHAAAPRA